MDQHEIIQDIKRVAAELGHSPSREEYRQYGKIKSRDVYRYFENFTLARIAAGLESPKKQKKLSNEQLFGKDIVSEIQEIRARKSFDWEKVEPAYPILIAGDTHFPFADLDALTGFYASAEKIKPKIVIQVGDLYDMLSWGKFPKSRNIYTPHEEISLAHQMATEFWKTIRRIAPEARCYQLFGNHDVRPLKRILDDAPSLEQFFSIDKYYEFEGVSTNMDYRQELIIGDIVFHHGWQTQMGAHRDYNLMNTVVGHTHIGGVSLRRIRGKCLYELNAGYLGDPTSKGLSYTASKITKWTPGYGVIDEMGARFCTI